jgi:hypothetical protein
MVYVGSFLIIVAAIAGWISVGWMLSFLELYGEGNPFASILLLCSLAGFTVMAGFAAWGATVVTKSTQEQ